MTTNPRPISRRKILAGVGTVGLLTVGAGLGSGLRGDPQYTHYTYAQEDGGPNLLVTWYETYNDGAGGPVDRSSPDLEPNNASFEDAAANDEFVDDLGLVFDARGPVIDIPNAMPGDTGSLIVGLTVEEVAGAVWFRAVAPERFPDGTLNYRENGQTEPEVAAGDSSADRGELQEEVIVTVWYDVGVAGFGACNGERDPLEAVVATGTLEEVAAELEAGVRLDTELFGQCLEAGQTRCLGFSWEVPTTAGNRIQTDSVTFDLEFVATDCEEPVNPFGGTVDA